MYTQFHPTSPNPGAPDMRGFRVVGWNVTQESAEGSCTFFILQSRPLPRESAARRNFWYFTICSPFCQRQLPRFLAHYSNPPTAASGRSPEGLHFLCRSLETDLPTGSPAKSCSRKQSTSPANPWVLYCVCHLYGIHGRIPWTGPLAFHSPWL